MGLPLLAPPRTRQQIEATAAPGAIAAPVPLLDAAKAGFDNAWNVTRLGAREEAYRAAVWSRWKQIQHIAGQQFPMSASMLGASPDNPSSYAYGGAALGAQGAIANQVSDADFAQRLDDLRARSPGPTSAIPTDQQLRQQVSDRLTAISGRAAAAGAQHPLATFAGGAVAQAIDPVNVVVAGATGGGAEAAPLATSLLLGGAKQALIWGGLAAAQAPAKSAEAAKFGGPEYGTKDAVSDVEGAAAGGFLLHGAGELLGAAGKAILGKGAGIAPEAVTPASEAPGASGGVGLPTAPASNVIDAEFASVEPASALPAPATVPERLALPAPADAARDSPTPPEPAPPPADGQPVVPESVSEQALPDVVRGAAQAVDKIGAADAAIGSLRDGGDVDAAHAAIAQGEPPILPEPTQDPATLLTEDDPAAGPAPETPSAADGVTLGDATTYRGRSIYSATFDPQVVNTAPDVFQYKSGGDAQGVTDRLNGVQTWDPTSAGRAMVYENDAGAYTVADGHQRLGLAKRLTEQNPTLDALLFRSADGWSAQDVRTLAALKNIREGSGTPLDAAKVLRTHPDALNDDSLPITGTVAEQGRGLARLSDDAFGAVVNDVVPQNYAALIGNMAGDRPDLHAGMVDLLHKGRPANADEARALVSESLNADWAKNEGVQDDMFGGPPAQSTVIARAKVKAAVLRQVRGDAKLFATLTRQADAIEAGGNALARSSNEAALAVNRAAESMIAKLAYRDGPIGAAMREAAGKVAEGEPPASAARRVADLVRKAIADGEDAEQARAERITPDPPSPAAEKVAAGFDEPGGKAQAEQLRPKPEEAAAESAAHEAFPGLFDDIPRTNPSRVAFERLAQCAPGGG